MPPEMLQVVGVVYGAVVPHGMTGGEEWILAEEDLVADPDVFGGWRVADAGAGIRFWGDVVRLGEDARVDALAGDDGGCVC